MAKRPTRPIRVDLTEWDEFGAACEAQGTDRSSVIRAYMRRYTAAWKGRRGRTGDTPTPEDHG